MSSDFHILMIEDSPADAKIFERALRECAVDYRLTWIGESQKALEYLTRISQTHGAPEDEPDLVLVDLNLPGIDGSQILAFIKNDPYLKAIPVVVLTTSGSDEDVIAVYEAGANTFIRKPSEYPRYTELVAVLRTYWRSTALGLPRGRPRP